MARFAFVTFSDRGHLNAMLALAQRLEQDGNEVLLVSLQAPVDDAARAAGLAASALCVAPEVGRLAAPVARRSIELGRWIGNARWLERWLTGTLLEPLGRQVEALREIFREHRPDAIIADAMAYAGAVAAELEGLRWAGVATSLQAVPWTSLARSSVPAFASLDGARSRCIAELGASLRFRVSDAISPWLNVVFASPALLARGGAVLPPDVHAVGAALPIASRRGTSHAGARGDRPLVYVAFGSHQSPPEGVYRAIGDALRGDEAEVVMALKDLVDEPFVRALPAHVRPVAFAPQLALLERASVMIHHGGANSVMECIAHEVPMLMVPLGYDQPICAAIVARAGVGHAVELDASAARWRELLLPILRDDAPERAAARAIDAREDGAARAAELILRS